MSSPHSLLPQVREKRELIAVCEGCGKEEIQTTTNPRRVYASQPEGWLGCGGSKYRIGVTPRIAIWCPECQQAGRVR